jgi:hypothetical protein
MKLVSSELSEILFDMMTPEGSVLLIRESITGASTRVVL